MRTREPDIFGGLYTSGAGLCGFHFGEGVGDGDGAHGEISWQAPRPSTGCGDPRHYDEFGDPGAHEKQSRALPLQHLLELLNA